MAIVVRPSASLSRALRDAHLGERVDRRRRLVEHEHVGIDQRGADQRDELTLARRQLGAALADLGVQAVLQRRPASRRGRAR